jgi:hypothetical protein
MCSAQLLSALHLQACSSMDFVQMYLQSRNQFSKGSRRPSCIPPHAGESRNFNIPRGRVSITVNDLPVLESLKLVAALNFMVKALRNGDHRQGPGQ